MEKLRILESAIIGLFVGVIISTYILFITSNHQILGILLNNISFAPILKLFPQEYRDSIVFDFLFFILVYIVYAIIIGLIMRKGTKTKVIIYLIIILLTTGIFFEQKKIQATSSNIAEYNIENEVPQGQLSFTKKEQYFGNEARGDLNNDTKEDVAFIIKRNAGDTAGDRYYLTSSLQSNKGYIGTNLIFIDEKIEIKNIIIENGIIKISYTKIEDGNTEEKDISENILYAQIIDNTLKEIDIPIETTTSTSTQEL